MVPNTNRVGTMDWRDFMDSPHRMVIHESPKPPVRHHDLLPTSGTLQQKPAAQVPSTEPLRDSKIVITELSKKPPPPIPRKPASLASQPTIHTDGTGSSWPSPYGGPEPHRKEPRVMDPGFPPTPRRNTTNLVSSGGVRLLAAQDTSIRRFEETEERPPLPSRPIGDSQRNILDEGIEEAASIPTLQPLRFEQKYGKGVN